MKARLILIGFFAVGVFFASGISEASTNTEIVKRSVFGSSGKKLESLLKHHPEILKKTIAWSEDSIPVDIVRLEFQYRKKLGFPRFKEGRPSTLEVNFTIYQGKASFLSVERNGAASDVSDFNYREFIETLEEKKSFDDMILLDPQSLCGTPYLQENQPPFVPRGE